MMVRKLAPSMQPHPVSAWLMPWVYSRSRFSAMVAAEGTGPRREAGLSPVPGASEAGMAKIDVRWASTGAWPQPASTLSNRVNCERYNSVRLSGLPPMRPATAAVARAVSGWTAPASMGRKSGSFVFSGCACTAMVQPGNMPSARALPVSRVRWSLSAMIET